MANNADIISMIDSTTNLKVTKLRQSVQSKNLLNIENMRKSADYTFDPSKTNSFKNSSILET